jgi:hypothetical protein
MVGKNQFYVGFSRFPDVRGICSYFHPFVHTRYTGTDEGSCILDFHNAHSARGVFRNVFAVAESRNIDTDTLCSIENGDALWNLIIAVINFNIDRFGFH